MIFIKGKIIKISRTSIFILAVSEWREYPIQLAVRKKDLKDIAELLGKAIEFEIDERGYFKLKKKLRKGTGLETT